MLIRKSHDLQGNIVDIALAVPLKIALAMVQKQLHTMKGPSGAHSDILQHGCVSLMTR